MTSMSIITAIIGGSGIAVLRLPKAQQVIRKGCNFSFKDPFPFSDIYPLARAERIGQFRIFKAPREYDRDD